MILISIRGTNILNRSRNYIFIFPMTSYTVYSMYVLLMCTIIITKHKGIYTLWYVYKVTYIFKKI